MKHALLLACSLLFCSVLFSQEQKINRFTEDFGHGFTTYEMGDLNEHYVDGFAVGAGIFDRGIYDGQSFHFSMNQRWSRL
ncbi:MAG: hypothetical protein MK081_10540 [Flavobacteriales bacterium]|nr:hypothetical protein [Flavobacteriales bacterium]